jgi:small subunit ribosomal protein S16
MQRTGRKGHAMFRVVVQDSRRTPTSGKIVAFLGNYDPHTKNVNLDKDKAKFYLEHGAQPSDRVARLLTAEGLEMPKWVKSATEHKREVRNPEKRRSTRPEAPAEPEAEATEAEEARADNAEAPAEEPAAEEMPAEAPADSTEAAAEEAPAEESAPEETEEEKA